MVAERHPLNHLQVLPHVQAHLPRHEVLILQRRFRVQGHDAKRDLEAFCRHVHCVLIGEVILARLDRYRGLEALVPFLESLDAINDSQEEEEGGEAETWERGDG